MTNVPDGARVTEDGYYWLDTTSNEWKPVRPQVATTDPAASAGDRGEPGAFFAYADQAGWSQEQKDQFVSLNQTISESASSPALIAEDDVKEIQEF